MNYQPTAEVDGELREKGLNRTNVLQCLPVDRKLAAVITARSQRGRLPWPIEWLLLCVAAINVVWVLFDFTYIPLHDFYTLNLPQVRVWYDPVKGIEPHRTTQAYIQTVDALEKAPSEAQQAILTQLQSESALILSENPFLLAEKQGVLERIKSRLREHLALPRSYSSTAAFRRFWSAENLTPERRAQELKFFNTRLRPLFKLNYYRRYSEDGDFADYYPKQYDLWFMAVFAVELISRVLASRQQWSRLTWKGACIANSIDLLNLLPAVNLIPGIHLSWLALGRVFSFGERLERLGVFPSLIALFIHRYSLAIADEVTDLVVIKVLTQVQEVLRTADFTQLLLKRPSPQANTALDRFVKTQIALVVKDVLPQVRPELEQLITHALRRTLPLPTQLAKPLIARTLSAVYGATNMAIQDDPEGEQLIRKLVAKLVSVLGSQWHQQGTDADVQSLAIELLEQAKRDYSERNALD